MCAYDRIQDMAEPILETTQPRDAKWGADPNHKLAWLSMFYGIKPDVIAQAADVSRAQIYHFIAGTRGMSSELKTRIADVIGFPPEAWDWTLDEFDEWIRQNYPGFTGKLASPAA